MTERNRIRSEEPVEDTVLVVAPAVVAVGAADPAGLILVESHEKPKSSSTLQPLIT